MTLPLIEVKELYECGELATEFNLYLTPRNQWAEQLQIQAHNPPLSERNWAHDNKPKPVIEVYEWPEFTR